MSTLLREVMQQRSNVGADEVVHHLRLAGVRSKIAGARRRRAAVTVSAAVVVLLVGVAVAAPLLGLRSASRPAPASSGYPVPGPVRTIEGFPEYALGARVFAAKSVRLPERSVSFTFAPPTLELVIFQRCEPSGKGLSSELTMVGWSRVVAGRCDLTWQVSALEAAEMGIVVGQPITVTVRVSGQPAVENSSLSVAIAARVPWEQYHFPERPSPLQSLRPLSSGPREVAYMAAVAGEPNRAQTVSVTWRSRFRVEMVSQTPGFLRLTIDEKANPWSCEWWDYGQEYCATRIDEVALQVRDGDVVTITVRPENMTGDWAVRIYDPG